MATVFEYPMPALDDAQTPQISHQRRRRDSVEVIDVDELDDEIYQTHRPPESGPSRPAQRRRLTAPSEIISLVDSDEDDIIVSEASTRPASRTRLQSPPPPRNQSWGFVPPVPQVPHRYAGQTSLPMRRQGPAYSPPPVVRPSDQPFPFEANMYDQQLHRQLPPLHGPEQLNRPPQLHIPRLHSPNPLPPRPLQPIHPAPPSHHVPAMGLGGALIAQNRPRHHNQHRAHPYEAGPSLFGRVGSNGVRRIFGGPAGGGSRNGINFLAIGNNFEFLNDPFDGDGDLDRILALQLLAEDDGEGLADLDPAFNPARAFIRSEVLRRRNNARDEAPYTKEYTHLLPPENGFTFDFAPKPPVEVIDVTSPSISKKQILSPKPIVIDDDADVGLSGSDHQSVIQEFASSKSSPRLQPHQTPHKPASTTVLACARCLDPLVLGNNLTSEEQKSRRVWGLRCGHLIDGKCLKEIGQPHYTDQPTTLAAIDRKGKGKAKAVAEDNDEYRDTPGAYDHESESNSIRSRLRPRRAATPTLASSSSNSANTTVRRGARAKNTQLPTPEYIWHCPVTGCGRAHVSVKVNAEWIPERDDSIYADSTVQNVNGGSGRGRRGGRGRSRANLYGILNDPDHQITNDGPRGAIPLFL